MAIATIFEDSTVEGHREGSTAKSDFGSGPDETSQLLPTTQLLRRIGSERGWNFFSN